MAYSSSFFCISPCAISAIQKRSSGNFCWDFSVGKASKKKKATAILKANLLKLYSGKLNFSLNDIASIELNSSQVRKDNWNKKTGKCYGTWSWNKTELKSIWILQKNIWSLFYSTNFWNFSPNPHPTMVLYSHQFFTHLVFYIIFFFLPSLFK